MGFEKEDQTKLIMTEGMIMRIMREIMLVQMMMKDQEMETETLILTE